MSIQQKISALIPNFVVLQASWIPWLLVGFSSGGILVVVQRALTLILNSHTVRKLRARTRRSQNLMQSSPCLSSGW